MIRTALALLLLIPLFDVVLLVIVAGEIGAPATVALVVLTGLVGLMLARFQGRRTLVRLQRTVRAGEVPTDELLDGAFILVAAAVLLTPGLVTDAIGLLLLFGPSRRPIRYAVKKWFVIPYFDRRSGGFVTGEVYTAGFPGGEGTSNGEEPIDVSVDIEDVEDDPSDEGNA